MGRQDAKGTVTLTAAGGVRSRIARVRRGVSSKSLRTARSDIAASNSNSGSSARQGRAPEVAARFHPEPGGQLRDQLPGDIVLQGPVAVEFRAVVDKMKIGRTMEAALQDTADRLGTPEFQFFVITLAIQRETGGNLAETLSNLADVLRKRAQMKLKIKAMSSESKASAWIVGSLPFVVFVMVWFVNPDYIGGFFFEPRLIVAGLGGLVWMGIGVFVMAKMVNFEI